MYADIRYIYKYGMNDKMLPSYQITFKPKMSDNVNFNNVLLKLKDIK